MARPFLTAQWKNLFLATYAVPPSLLEPRLPPGLVLDLYQGQACVSLVAFEFLDTRVWGIPWPFFRNFGELNLRFYVRHGEQRGVCFIREFVPQWFVAWVARTIYNEPYLAAPITATKQESAEVIEMTYELNYARKKHLIQVRGKKPSHTPGPDSVEHFFKEHHWGYGRTRRGDGIRYEVAHPIWDVYPVESYRLDFDFATVYGQEWGFLKEASPISTVLAVGSGISVFPQGQLVK